MKAKDFDQKFEAGEDLTPLPRPLPGKAVGERSTKIEA